MKFDQDDCWKHDNCLDVFFFIHSVKKDEDGKATLIGHWMVQGIDSYWMCQVPSEEIFINENEYEKWKEYEPKGMFI